jgi:hypothetical protein
MRKVLVIFCSLALLCLFYGRIIISPDSYLFSDSGDGIKNYYTPGYYTKYEKGIHFSGMNEPYGEHIIYTDNQPAISSSVVLLKNIFPGIEDHMIGILNILMLFSILISVFFIYKILKKLNLPEWYAVIASLLIGFLSPQIARMAGHYALAYCCYIPVLWYVFINYFNGENKIRTSLWIIFVITLFSFIHPYYGLMGVLFFLAYSLVHVLFNTTGFKNILLAFFKHALVGIIPLLIFSLWMSLTDHVTDRPSNPWGFYAYRAFFEGVFLPGESPFLDVWNYFIRIRKIDFESKAYVGFAASLVLLFTLIRWIKYLVNKKYKRILRMSLPSFLTVSFWTGVLVLLFSMGIPFIWGMDFLLDIITPLKQFRSLGRFAWVFYYIYTVYAAYYIFLIYRRLCINKFDTIAVFILFFLTFSWALDAYALNHYVSKLIHNKHQNAFTDEYKLKLTEAGYQPENFQAILPLPYYLIGSEKVGSLRDHKTESESMKASYAMHLPMIGGSASRTSLEQSKKLAGIISDPLINKPILKDLKNDKPLLLIVNKNAQLFFSECILIKNAKYIMEYESMSYYSLPLSAFNNEFQKEAITMLNYSTLLRKGNNFLTDGDPSRVIIKHYDEPDHKNFFYGNGSMYVKEGSFELFNGAMIPGKYEISFWVMIDPETLLPVFHYQQMDSAGNTIAETNFRASDSYDIVDNWVRVNYTFKIGENQKVNLFLKGENYRVDELMIRLQDQKVFNNINDSTFFYNNIPVKNSK